MCAGRACKLRSLPAGRAEATPEDGRGGGERSYFCSFPQPLARLGFDGERRSAPPAAKRRRRTARVLPAPQLGGRCQADGCWTHQPSVKAERVLGERETAEVSAWHRLFPSGDGSAGSRRAGGCTDAVAVQTCLRQKQIRGRDQALVCRKRAARRAW